MKSSKPSSASTARGFDLALAIVEIGIGKLVSEIVANRGTAGSGRKRGRASLRAKDRAA